MDTPAYLFPEMKEWLLILPISYRLYTSVIVLNPEKCLTKETWSTDMSPTTIFYWRQHPRGSTDVMCTTGMVGEGCTRGMGMRVGPGGLYRGTTQTAPRTHI